MTQTTNNKLRRTRQQKRISLIQASNETHIPKEILRAIESGESTGLAHGYEAGIISTYQRYLGIESLDRMPASKRPRHKAGSRHFRPQQVYATTDFLKRSLTILIFVIVGIYALWQSWQLIRPPHLRLDQPDHDLITNQPTIDLKGSTATDATLYLNDSLILVDSNGYFELSLPLRKGVNEVDLVSINSFGRRSELKRTVIYTPDN